MPMKKSKDQISSKDNARSSVTETAGITNGRARSERRLASGNRRSGAVDAIKAAKKAGRPKGG